MLRDLLASEGIAAQIPGAEHRGMLGVLGSYVSIPLMVDARDAAAAREVLAALDAAPMNADEHAVEHGPSAAHDAEDALPDVAPRRKRVALFVGALCPGAAQLYLRQTLLGLVLLLLGGYSFFSVAVDPGAFYPFFAFWLFGLVDGALGVKRFNRHGPRSMPAQAIAAGFAVLLAGTAMKVGPQLGHELDDPYLSNADYEQVD